MSLKAMSWVMEDAPTDHAGELLVLYALADKAHDDGMAAWPSQTWLAYRARCTPRSVRNHLKSLEKKGLISRGDQRLVDHLPVDRRPTVWNLHMGQKRQESYPEFRARQQAAKKGKPKAGGKVCPPEKRVENVRPGGKSRSDRGENLGQTGGKPLSPNTSLDTSLDTSPPIVPQGDDDPSLVVEAEIVEAPAGGQLALVEDSAPEPAAPAKKSRKSAPANPDKLPPASTDYTPDFNQFWEIWPGIKASKVETFRRWRRALAMGATAAEILDGVEKFAMFHRLRGTDRKYITGFRRWFDNLGWADELDMSVGRHDKLDRSVLHELHEAQQRQQFEQQLAEFQQMYPGVDPFGGETPPTPALAEDGYDPRMYE